MESVDHKPFVDMGFGHTPIKIYFEHFSPKRIKKEGLKKIRPGTECLLDVAGVFYRGRSYLHKGDKFNGNLGIYHSLEEALNLVNANRDVRVVVFAAVKDKIARSQQPPAVDVYQEV